MVRDIGTDWTWSKLCFLVLCFHTRITICIYPPSAQVNIQSHPSLLIIAFALCISKYSHITPHIHSSALSLLSLSLLLPLKIILQGRHQTSKVSAQALVAFPGHSVLLLNIGGASFSAKGNWSGQKDGNLQQFPLLNFFSTIALSRIFLAWPQE